MASHAICSCGSEPLPFSLAEVSILVLWVWQRSRFRGPEKSLPTTSKFPSQFPIPGPEVCNTEFSSVDCLMQVDDFWFDPVERFQRFPSLIQCFQQVQLKLRLFFRGDQQFDR